MAPGTYADALVPSHLAALVALTYLIAVGDRGRATRIALAIVVLIALLALITEPVAVVIGIAALVLSVPAGAAAAIYAFVMRRDPRRLAQGLLWLGLVIGLPAIAAGSYVNATSLFCF